jgi:hypothetical protein
LALHLPHFILSSLQFQVLGPSLYITSTCKLLSWALIPWGDPAWRHHPELGSSMLISYGLEVSSRMNPLQVEFVIILREKRRKSTQGSIPTSIHSQFFHKKDYFVFFF